ncbi:MAG: ATP-dependent Clp protease adaptor ClpS [Fimbriimonas sp.]
MERLSAPGIIEHTEIDDGSTSSGPHYIVTVYDNDHNTMEEVTHILMAATGCSLPEAEMETWEVHHLGKSVVHHGSKEECTEAAAIIATIGIKVVVTSE